MKVARKPRSFHCAVRDWFMASPGLARSTVPRCCPNCESILDQFVVGLGGAAFGADPAVGDVVVAGAGGDAAVGIAEGFVVDVGAVATAVAAARRGHGGVLYR